MAFNQCKHLPTNKLEVADEGVIEGFYEADLS